MSRPDRPLRVMVLGIRGIPDVQGGVETHAQHLYPRLVRLGLEVEAITRSPFCDATHREYSGVRLTRLWSTRMTGLEALVHSFLGVAYAAIKRPDVLHIHAIGPGIVTPIARLLGLRVVVTNHGPDYDRDKWGRIAKLVLRIGESLSMRFANRCIAISSVIAELVKRKYGVESVRIPNGVPPATLETGIEALNRYGLTPGRYVLEVGRMVPEKRQLDLISAFRESKVSGWKLVLVGGLGDDDYSREVRSRASGTDVVLTGFLKDQPLRQLYSHAGLFVLPSSHEGLPIAMLEALSFGLPVVASAIPANLEVGLGDDQYFPMGDITELSERIRRFTSTSQTAAGREALMRWVADRYDWDNVALETARVLAEVGGHSLPTPSKA